MSGTFPEITWGISFYENQTNRLIVPYTCTHGHTTYYSTYINNASTYDVSMVCCDVCAVCIRMYLS